jgi:hypothetical protein
VPEVIPDILVVVYEQEDDGGYKDHTWYPFFSGDDGSLITNEKFVPFNATEASADIPDDELLVYGKYGEITLRDSETGNTVDLYPIPDEENLRFYGNDRFGYSLSIPHKIFTKVVVLPDNGDGMILESKDGKARFRVSGGFLIGEAGETLYESYAEVLRNIGGVENAFHHDVGDDYWELFWRKGDIVYKRKFLVNGEEAWSDCEIYFEWEEGVVDDTLPDLTQRAIESLAFPKG